MERVEAFSAGPSEIDAWAKQHTLPDLDGPAPPPAQLQDRRLDRHGLGENLTCGHVLRDAAHYCRVACAFAARCDADPPLPWTGRGVSREANVSTRIIAELERGAAPWVKPWSATAGQNVPQNAVTNRPYSGCNVIALPAPRLRTTPRCDYSRNLRPVKWGSEVKLHGSNLEPRMSQLGQK